MRIKNAHQSCFGVIIWQDIRNVGIGARHPDQSRREQAQRPCPDHKRDLAPTPVCRHPFMVGVRTEPRHSGLDDPEFLYPFFHDTERLGEDRQLDRLGRIDGVRVREARADAAGAVEAHRAGEVRLAREHIPAAAAGAEAPQTAQSPAGADL